MSYGEPIVLRAQADLESVAANLNSATEAFARPASEIQFIEKLRAGDVTALDRLVAERAGDIYALLCRLTDDAEEARDLTQETFLQAFRNIARFRGEADIRTWLYRIAVNQARNRRRWWKRRRREKTVSLDAPIDFANGDAATGATIGSRLPDTESRDPEQTLLARERERALLDALSSLNGKFREVVALRDIEGLSYEEVAEALEISVGTVKSRLSRARAELRKRLECSL